MHKDYEAIKRRYPDFIKDYDKIVSDNKHNAIIINYLNQDIKKYIATIDNLKEEISELKTIRDELNQEKKNKNNLEKSLKEIKAIYKDESQIYENKKAEDFYDVIIKINSIQNLAEGWDISMIDKGKENYEKYKDEPIIRVGVIGNENKGKSTILRKLSDFDLPTGYSIKTEGLSIKYPELKEHKNLKIVLLDSAGFETPVLNSVINDNNKSEILEMSGNEFKEKARDKLLTEVFLQNYIIKNSDLLLLVFGKLTFEEQKLLEKVKKDMKNLKRRESLIVIHNLKEFERKIQVENYIKETLSNSLTFKLGENLLMDKENEEKKWSYYYEPNSNPKIFHLIFAREGTEAGDFYNKGTIKYILAKINNITDKQSFDIINSIKETFCSVSESILEVPLKKEEDIIIEDNKKIKLNNTKKQIKLKRCLIDEIGFSNFLSNGFEPKYEYYITDDKLIIEVEMPGDYENTKIKKETEGSYTFINISGNKVDKGVKKDKKENFFNKREYGEFHINIKIDKISLESNKLEVKKAQNNKGVTTFIYNIKKEEEEIEF